MEISQINEEINEEIEGENETGSEGVDATPQNLGRFSLKICSGKYSLLIQTES